MDPLTLLFVALAAWIAVSKNSTVQGVITGVSTVTKTIGKAASFIAAQYGNAQQLQDETGISPVVTLIQAAYESNYGTSQLATQYHNLFGIKPSQAWTKEGKPQVNLPTNEAQADGSLVKMDQYFRAYSSDLDSMRDWATFLQTLYPLSYQAAQNGDLDLFFDGLAQGKYGAYAGPTDGSYIPTYKKEALALLPSIQGNLPTGVA